MSTLSTEQRWDALVSQFRRVCLLRRQSKLMESERILSGELPRSIASWSQSFEAEPDTKRSRLNSMFHTEQRRIEDAWLVQELMTTRFNDLVIPALCQQVAQEVRAVVAKEMATQDRRPGVPVQNSAGPSVAKPRVEFDDIPGIIDLVLAEDRIRENARHLEAAV